MILDVDDTERLNIFDIDADAGVYGLSEYATEIFQHLREAEVRWFVCQCCEEMHFPVHAWFHCYDCNTPKLLLDLR